MFLCIEWLSQEAKRLNKKYWQIEEIPQIYIEKEWDRKRSILAQYRSKNKTIHFNYEKTKHYSKTRIRGILLHELCHWNLDRLGKPYMDSDVEFALELIRVRAANTCNHDDDAKNAMLEAQKFIKENKKREVFELRDSAYDLDIKLRHKRKSSDEFREDVKNSIIRFHNDTISDIESDSEYYGFSLEELAHMLCEWYGYEIVNFNIIESISFTSECDGNIGYRDLIIEQLSSEFEMDYDEINEILAPEKKTLSYG